MNTVFKVLGVTCLKIKPEFISASFFAAELRPSDYAYSSVAYTRI